MQYATVVALAMALAGSAAAAPSPQANPKAQLHGPSVIPAAWKQVGLSSTSKPVEFTMSLKGENMDQLEAKMLEIAASQGNWLTPDELAYYTTPSADSVAAVKTFLTGAGVPESAISFGKNNEFVTVTTDVGTTQTLFASNLYDFSFQGATYPRTQSLNVPSHLADVIENVQPLIAFPNVRAGPNQKTRINAAAGGKPKPTSSSSSSAPAPTGGSGSATVPSSCTAQSYITPQCLRDLFGTSSYTPKPVAGQLDVTVMGYIGQYVSQSDLTSFLQQFRPDAAGYQLPIVNAAGGQNDPTNPGTEAMLDVEYVVSTNYPLNNQFLYYGSQTGDIFQQGLNYIYTTYTNLPGVISTSYGDDEKSESVSAMNAICSTAQKLTAMGTTVVFASGDNGVDSLQSSSAVSCSNGFDPTYPSGCQYILSVGGTQNFSPEVAVNPSLPGGFWSGGGFSTLAARPSYQNAAVSAYLTKLGSTSQGKYNASGRAFPDVSTQAATYAIEQGGQLEGVSGTSCAAPVWSALLSLINDQRRADGKGRIGWVNPTLYGAPSTLTDITSGSNAGCPKPLTTAGFPCAAGWDPVTGLGTPSGKFAALLSLFQA